MSVLTMNGYEIERNEEDIGCIEYSRWNPELAVQPCSGRRSEMPPDLLAVDVQTFLTRMYENP